MTFGANNTAFAVSAATDSTLNTNTDYALLNGAGIPWVSENLSSVVYAGGGLQVQAIGLYSLDAWLSISGFPTDTASVALKLRVNGVPVGTRKVLSKASGAGSVESVMVHELLALNTGDVVQVYVASSAGGNLIIDSASVSINLIKAS